ncbi:MAG: hypothetical protein V4592_08195 [Bacteroidota bacterium]
MKKISMNIRIRITRITIIISVATALLNSKTDNKGTTMEIKMSVKTNRTLLLNNVPGDTLIESKSKK